MSFHSNQLLPARVNRNNNQRLYYVPTYNNNIIKHDNIKTELFSIPLKLLSDQGYFAVSNAIGIYNTTQ